jgi:hypothetical protein
LQYHFICMLDLPVCVGVSDCRLVYSDVVVVTEVHRNFSLVNWVSLSVMIELGILKWKTMP